MERTDMVKESAIEVRNLTRRFGKFTAVAGVSFLVKRGEIFGFLGANGAGKSTTIRMLCGLLQPTSGTAMVGGFDILSQAEDIKQNIGYMSQRFSLYNDLTVEQNILFYGGVYGLTNVRLRSRADWVLEMAGLRGRERTLTGELSGGWKQRLALGCAILHEPSIIFLDEPTGGVDPISRRNFWELINQLSAGGTTVLVTTHFLDEAEYCNDIILMDAGRVIATGSPTELKMDHIRSPILEVALGGGSVIEALETVRAEPWALETSVFGTSLHVMVADEGSGSQAIRRVLTGAGIIPRTIQKILPSLEDVFLYLLDQQRIKGVARV
jgi:ABC-2 type transport system ATP-binding protein